MLLLSLPSLLSLCQYCHYRHYCHYCHYCLIGRYGSRFKLPFGNLKVTFSQMWTDRRTDGPTDQRTNGPTDQRTNGTSDQRTNGQTTRLLELIRAAKKKNHLTPDTWHLTVLLTPDIWHMRHETWDMTHDTWDMGGRGEHSLLHLGIDSLLKTLNKRITYPMI